MSDIVKRLRERRANVFNEARGLTDRVVEENRNFSPDEQGTWDALNAELDALDARIKSAIDTEQRAKDQDDAFNKLSGKPVEKPGGQDGKQTSEFRAFLRGDQGAPRYYDVLPEGPVNFRTLSKLTAAAGLNTVPTTFYDRLIAHLIETSGVMQTGPTVLNTSSGEAIQIPKTTAHSSGAIVTEGAAIAASDPTFGQTTLGAFKYGCLIQVSRELLSDTGVDLEGYLSMQAGRALGNAFGAHMVTGTGTTMPRGVAVDATTGVTGPVGTSTSFGSQATVGMGGDLLIQLFYSVIAPYRNSSSAAWLVKDSTMGTLRQIKDTTGDYLVQGGLVGSTSETMMGKPIYTDPAVSAPGVSTTSVIFGDFSQYFVRIAGGVRFERSDDYAFNTDLVTFRCLLRADAALVDLTGAIKKFVHSAT
ncbi:MAG TPA: phage major capsid protein [Pseudonocardiaceae bacterium]|jgi:HK97 family phage major capsid protein